MTKQHVEGLEKALAFMETFSEGHEYLVGNILSVADFPFCVSIASLPNFDFDASAFANISPWYERMKDLKGYDQCMLGA